MGENIKKDIMFYKFGMYGFLKNMNFFEPFMMLFFMEKGFSFLQIGTLFAIQFVTSNVLQIPTGIFADTMGRRRTMIISFSSYIMSFILFYFSSSYIFFIVAMAFFAFAESFRSGTHKAMIFQYLKMHGWEKQKVYYYGHTRSFSQTGSAISALFAGAIVFASSSYNIVFLFTIIPYALDLLLILSYPAYLDGDFGAAEKKAGKTGLKNTFMELWESLKNPKLVKSVVNVALYTGYHDALKSYLQPVLKTAALALPVFIGYNEHERSAVVTAAVFFVLYLQTAYVSKKSGKIAEKLGHLSKSLNISLAAGLIVGVACGIMFNFKLAYVSVALYVGIYLIHNLRRPIGEAYVTDMVGNRILATALSAESQVATIFKALFAMFLGYAADRWGVGSAILSLSAMLLLFYPLVLARKSDHR